jgi:chromosome partitioning protein
MAACIVSFINLKGGVGKTTLALTIGEWLAYVYRKKVLLIDLDPQSNLSYGVLDETTRIRHQRAQSTVYHLFMAALNGTPWDIRGALAQNCSNVVERTQFPGHMQCLPCVPDLGRLDEEILERLERGERLAIDFRGLLRWQIDRVRNDFDYIIIDCPPSVVSPGNLYASNRL